MLELEALLIFLRDGALLCFILDPGDITGICRVVHHVADISATWKFSLPVTPAPWQKNCFEVSGLCSWRQPHFISPHLRSCSEKHGQHWSGAALVV